MPLVFVVVHVHVNLSMVLWLRVVQYPCPYCGGWMPGRTDLDIMEDGQVERECEGAMLGVQPGGLVLTREVVGSDV